MNCNRCGVCCMEQGSPPGYLFLMHASPNGHADWPDQEDIARLAALPQEAKDVIVAYIGRLRRGEVSGDGPSCWLDLNTRRCRFYRHRPEICRNLEVGSDGCLRWRALYQIGRRSP